VHIEVEDIENQRIDQFLTARLTDLSRSKIQALLKSGDILLNGKIAKAKQTITSGDTISVSIPEDNVVAENLPQDIPLKVLVNALLFHCKGNLSGMNGVQDDENAIDIKRPGIVHRLDKDTSGCMVVAKTDASHRSLAAQFASRTNEKRYLTVVQSKPNKEKDTIFTHIGRHPVNRMKMTVLCDLHTGRTHQIRVHMVHLGTPILGDPIYAKPARQPSQPGRLMLHAWQLVIDHPQTGERLAFQADIPDEYLPWTSVAEVC